MIKKEINEIRAVNQLRKRIYDASGLSRRTNALGINLFVIKGKSPPG
jgi:hypothetical protein